MTLAALALGVTLLHRGQGYDKAAAVFAGLPGGILTVMEVSRESEADASAVLFFQVFRIILGATLFPLAYALSRFDVPPTGVQAAAQVVAPDQREAVLLVVVCIAAAVPGRKLRFPSAEISAPLIAPAVLYPGGWVQMTISQWMPTLSFGVVGASIGTLLPRPGLRALLRRVRHTATLFAVFVTLTLAFALLARQLLGIPPAVAIPAFSPASLTEMIALAAALDLDPAMVAANNRFRMIFCSILAPVLLLAVGRRPPDPPEDAAPRLQIVRQSVAENAARLSDRDQNEYLGGSDVKNT